MSVKVFIDGEAKWMNLMNIRKEVEKIGVPVLVVPQYHQVSLYVDNEYIGNIQPTYPSEVMRESQVLAIMLYLNGGVPINRMFTIGG